MSQKLEPLIDPNAASDAGGVAGRVGFRYQDHVGAGYVIEMLFDSSLVQVEFETADDITLRWHADSEVVNEYVQVKTTESNTKWSIKEITDRVDSRPGSSLIEKSLKLDINTGPALFRFVTKRDVGTSLRPFLNHRDKRRLVKTKLDAAIKSIGNKWKTIKSACGRTTKDWAENLYWVVAGSETATQNSNINRILQLAERAGEIPSHSVACEIYHQLMTLVQTAGDASRVLDPDAKAINRDEALVWWKGKVDAIRQLNRAGLRVYRVSTEAFFADLHHINDATICRSLRAYDVEFDEGQWRKSELIEYLLRWLPEISLPANVLSEFDILHARELTRRAVARIEQSRVVSDEELFAELMLHAVLRHYFDSEPVACKIYAGTGPNRSITSAHIVPEDAGDQLWIGRSRITTAASHGAILKAVIAELEAAISSEFLKEERSLILTLREPRHMRATSLDTVLSARGKVEELRRCLHFPILMAYDSNVIQSGFCDDYLVGLRKEVVTEYESIKSRMTPALVNIHIHVFLIPVENPSGLIAEFGKHLRGAL